MINLMACVSTGCSHTFAIHFFHICILILVLWEIVWKSIALWHSARRNQKCWFVCLIIFNTAGILPILYWLKYRDKKQA
jgi:hypothetical protein